MEKINTFEVLVNFIIREYWGMKNKMPLKTTIEKDLGITGADGIGFLGVYFLNFKSKKP